MSLKTKNETLTVQIALGFFVYLGFFAAAKNKQGMLKRSRELSEGIGMFYNTADDLQND